MKNLKFTALALLVVVAFSACGQAATDGTTDGSTKEVAVVYPDGCVSNPSLTAKSPEAGEVTFDAGHSWYLDWSDSGTFYFMNWDGFDPQSYSSHEYTDKDVQVGWDLKTADKTKPKAGTWNYREKDANNELTWLNVSTKDLAGGVFDDKGKVEITYLGDDYVCGTVNADDGKTSIKGDFVAKYYNWKF